MPKTKIEMFKRSNWRKNKTLAKNFIGIVNVKSIPGVMFEISTYKVGNDPYFVNISTDGNVMYKDSFSGYEQALDYCQRFYDNYPSYQFKSIAAWVNNSEVRSLLYTGNALAGEVGELCNLVKKVIRDHDGIVYPEIKDKIISEIGDIRFYLSRACDLIGVTDRECEEVNLDKIMRRKHKQENKKIEWKVVEIEGDSNGLIGELYPFRYELYRDKSNMGYICACRKVNGVVDGYLWFDNYEEAKLECESRHMDNFSDKNKVEEQNG